MEKLLKTIQNMRLTKTEKLIADYIVDNINTIGLITVTDMSLKIGVSDTSIIRFIRSLGYKGFADFKHSMNKRIMEQYSLGLSPIQKFNNTKGKINNTSIINDVFRCAVDNLNNAMLNLDIQLINSIAECILSCKNKYIIGFRGTSCCADYFYRKAIYFLSHMVLCDKAEGDAIEKLVDISQDDCIVMFSFPKYSELNFTILELCQKQRVKIIIITDKVTSPLASYADYLITVNVNGVGFTNSYVVPLCVAEALAILIGQKAEKSSTKRLESLDNYIYKNKLY